MVQKRYLLVTTIFIFAIHAYAQLCYAENSGVLPSFGPFADEEAENAFYDASNCLKSCIAYNANAAIRENPPRFFPPQGKGYSSPACTEFMSKIFKLPELANHDFSQDNDPIYRQCVTDRETELAWIRNQCFPGCPTLYEESGGAEVTKLMKQIKSYEDLRFPLGGYVTNIGGSLGFFPWAYAYKIGFVRSGNGELSERMNTDWFLQHGDKLLPANAGALKIPFSSMAQYCPECTATKDAYKVIAFADLFADGNLDIWVMDQTGAIKHVRDGLPH